MGKIALNWGNKLYVWRKMLICYDVKVPILILAKKCDKFQYDLHRARHIYVLSGHSAITVWLNLVKSAHNNSHRFQWLAQIHVFKSQSSSIQKTLYNNPQQNLQIAR